MGMIGYIRKVSPADLENLQANPDTVKKFLSGGAGSPAGAKGKIDIAAMQTAMARAQAVREKALANGPIEDPQERARVQALIIQELKTAGFFGAMGRPEGGDALCLEKSWHTLHYLLTGSAREVKSPLGNAILGGAEIGPDIGYGPARFVTPGQVKETAAALAKLSGDDLAKRFDAKAMKAAKIYPTADEEELEMAQEYLGQLQDYYAQAASEGCGMLLYIR